MAKVESRKDGQNTEMNKNTMDMEEEGEEGEDSEEEQTERKELTTLTFDCLEIIMRSCNFEDSF